MRSPFPAAGARVAGSSERADRNNFLWYLYKAINQSLSLRPTIILTGRKNISTDRVPVIALINLGRNVLGAPHRPIASKIQPFPQIACPPNRRLEQPPSDYSHFQRNGSLRSAYAEAIEP